MSYEIDPDKPMLGWREWVRLPGLGVRLIKAKVDTGARTSALHAENIRYVRKGGRSMVRFTILPKQGSARGAVEAIAPLLEKRHVRSSNGQQELRPVILTTVDVGGDEWTIELTLTRRDLMGFRMLLGREAVKKRALVDPAHSFLTRKVKRRKKAKPRPRGKVAPPAFAFPFPVEAPGRDPAGGDGGDEPG